MTTACFNAIDEIENGEQVCKQVKHDIETSVILFRSLINSEPSVLSASDLVSAVSIV